MLNDKNKNFLYKKNNQESNIEMIILEKQMKI